MTDRPEQDQPETRMSPESATGPQAPEEAERPTEEFAQSADPTTVQPAVPVSDDLPAETVPNATREADAALGGTPPPWPAAPAPTSGDTAIRPTEGGASPEAATSGEPPEWPSPPGTTPPDAPAPEPSGQAQGQPWGPPWGPPSGPPRGPQAAPPYGQAPGGQSWSQSGLYGQPGVSGGPPPGQSGAYSQPYAQSGSYGGPPPGQAQRAPQGPPQGPRSGQSWGAPRQPSASPYQPYGAATPPPKGPLANVRSAKTFLGVAVALVVLALFTSFIAAITSRWGYVPTGVTVFVGMLNFAALVVGGLSIWRLLAAVEDLGRTVEGLTKED